MRYTIGAIKCQPNNQTEDTLETSKKSNYDSTNHDVVGLIAEFHKEANDRSTSHLHRSYDTTSTRKITERL